MLSFESGHLRTPATACRSGLLTGFAVLVLAALVGLVPQAAFAQANSSSVIGTVTDESGAAVPGATVTVTNNGTQAVRTVETNERGDYSVTALDIGIYEVSAQLEGFRTAVATDVRLEVDLVRRQNMTLQVGVVTEQVTV